VNKHPLFTYCLLATAMLLGVPAVQARSESVADVKVTETFQWLS
jgi:hypothetical protein